MQLRDYQINIINEIYSAWQQGYFNVLAQLHTGAGKTVIFTSIMANYTQNCGAIVHRSEIVSQISLALGRQGVTHTLIAQPQIIRNIVTLHMREFNRSFYNPHSRCFVAGVDTIIRMDEPWFKNVGLIVQDEAHHVLKNNKWGKAMALFPNARGLFVTATPVRADGHGLGRHADGLSDYLITGPSMRELINNKYLTDYRIFAPPSDLDLSNVPFSASGDYSPPKLRSAVHKSHITGDVVNHYLKIAPGKLGVTFAVDIESAKEIAANFRANGVPAEVITGKTPDLLRAQIMQRFKNREILQLVNVDLLGEGVDVPAIEVVSMARPTQSYALYSQQLGRGLRPLPGKTHAIIIDHVGNWIRHGLPDCPRNWSLDRRERKTRSTPEDVIPLRNCLNPTCLLVYERVYKKCPHCGFVPPLSNRSGPEFVDGDLFEVDIEVLRLLRKEINRIDSIPHPPQHLDSIAQKAVINRHLERQRVQAELREKIALWAGEYKARGADDAEILRRFYFNFGTDVLTAQTLNIKDAQELANKIEVRKYE